MSFRKSLVILLLSLFACATGAAEEEKDFAANVYIHLRWHDPRLAQTGTYSRSFPLESVWNPQVIVANQQGILRTSLPREVILTSYLALREHTRLARKIDRVARFAFPTSFVFLFGITFFF